MRCPLSPEDPTPLYPAETKLDAESYSTNWIERNKRGINELAFFWKIEKASLELLKFNTGSKAEGNKTKEIALGYIDE